VLASESEKVPPMARRVTAGAEPRAVPFGALTRMGQRWAFIVNEP
jgi:hypothetical protein